MSLTPERSPSRGYQYATRLPSGEKSGVNSNFGFFVSGRAVPAATSTTCTFVWSLSPYTGVSCRVMRSCLPSGDHDSGDGTGPGGSYVGRLHAPVVMRLAVPPAAS